MGFTKSFSANALRGEWVVVAEGDLFHVPKYPVLHEMSIGLVFVSDKESVEKTNLLDMRSFQEQRMLYSRFLMGV